MNVDNWLSIAVGVVVGILLGFGIMMIDTASVVENDKNAFKEGWKYGFFDAVILTETGGLGNAATHLNMYQQDSIEYFRDN